jgi:hypothetical protein
MRALRILLTKIRDKKAFSEQSTAPLPKIIRLLTKLTDVEPTTTTTTTTMSNYASILWLLFSLPLGNSIPLLDGRFETSTDVAGYLNLGNDIADIQRAETTTEKLDIYRNGRNAFFTDDNGQT